jgi:hypothetical protein
MQCARPWQWWSAGGHLRGEERGEGGVIRYATKWSTRHRVQEQEQELALDKTERRKRQPLHPQPRAGLPDADTGRALKMHYHSAYAARLRAGSLAGFALVVGSLQWQMGQGWARARAQGPGPSAQRPGPIEHMMCY